MTATPLSLDFRIKAADDDDYNVLAFGEQSVTLDIVNSSNERWTLLGREGTPPSAQPFSFAPELWLRPGVILASSLERIRMLDRSWRATVTGHPDGCAVIGLVPETPHQLEPGAQVSVRLEGVMVSSAGARKSQVQLAYQSGRRGSPAVAAARVHSLRIVPSHSGRLPFVNAQASSFLDKPFNGLTRTAGRLIEYPASGTPWTSNIGDVAPWFWVSLAELSVIRSLTLAWGARPESYRVLSSVDGVTWTDTGVTGSMAKERAPHPGWTANAYELPGWPSPTRFIKVEATLGSNLRYVDCGYILATGVKA